jgi:hypothetical protein
MHVRLVILLAGLVGTDTTAGVRMLVCEPRDPDTEGLVVYLSHMRAVEDTARMSLRVRLFEKYGDGEFERVSAPDLGVWQKSRFDASIFRFKQRIEKLHPGAVYRAVVHYRWQNADGEVIKSARRRSEVCNRNGDLPNLRVASVETRPGEVEGTAVYRTTIVNQGESAAQNIGVLLRVDGEVVDEELIDALAPSEQQTVTFTGPVCRRKMRAVVDPKDLIAESREQDNVLSPSCL